MGVTLLGLLVGALFFANHIFRGAFKPAPGDCLGELHWWTPGWNEVECTDPDAVWQVAEVRGFGRDGPELCGNPNGRLEVFPAASEAGGGSQVCLVPYPPG